MNNANYCYCEDYDVFENGILREISICEKAKGETGSCILDKQSNNSYDCTDQTIEEVYYEFRNRGALIYLNG